MASSSTASNLQRQQNPSLSDIHRHVMDVAANPVGVAAIPSTFIGPASPTSVYLGEETIVNGPVSETAVPIMFRCVWGSGTQSRHVLVRIKPSVSEHALALRLCQIFGIPTSGGVFMEPVFKWMLGLMPYSMGMDKGKPIPNDLLKNVPCVNKPLVLPFADVVQKLGSTLSGIVDLDVLICDEQFDSCTLCENKPSSIWRF